MFFFEDPERLFFQNDNGMLEFPSSLLLFHHEVVMEAEAPFCNVSAATDLALRHCPGCSQLWLSWPPGAALVVTVLGTVSF